MSVGIDSMILIYAGLAPVKAGGAQSEEYADLCVRAKLLMHRLAREKVTVLLPTVAISEVLIPVPKSQKGALIAAIQKRFVCPPFDVAAASIAADIWSEHKKLPQDVQYCSRQVLRADVHIVASIYAAGGREFYSHDEKCRALASIVMKSYDLPTGDPEDMFLMDDIRRGDV